MQPSYLQQPEQSFNNYNYTPQPPVQAPPPAGGVVRGVALDELRGISLDDRERKRQEQLKFRMDIERQIKEKQDRKAKEKRDLEEQIRKEDLANQGYNGFYPPTSQQSQAQSQAMPQAMPQVNNMGYYSPSPIPSNFPQFQQTPQQQQFQQSQQQNMSYNNSYNNNNVVHPTNVPGLMVNQQGPLCVSPFPQYNQPPPIQQPQQYNNNNSSQMMMMMNQQPPQQMYQQPQFSPSHQQQLPPPQQQMFNMNQQVSPQQQMMMINNMQQNQPPPQLQQPQQQQYNNEDLPPIPQTGESISNLLKRVYKPKSLDDDEEEEPDNNNKHKVSNNKESKPKRSISIKKKPIHNDEEDSDEQREDKPKKQKKKIVDAYKKDKEREKYNNNVAQRMKAIEDKKREELQRKAEERERRIREKSKELNPVKLPVRRASIHATKVAQQTPNSNNIKPSSRENKFENNKPKRHVSIKREVQVLQEEEDNDDAEEEDNNSNDEYQYEEDKRIIKPKQSPRIITNNNNNNIKPSLIPKPNSVLKRKSSKNSNSNNKPSYISPVKDNGVIDPEEIPIIHKQSPINNHNISPIQSTPNNYDIKRSKSPITSPTKSKAPVKSSYNELAEMCHKLEEEQEILKSELHQQFEIVKSLKSQTPRKPTSTNDIENEFVTPRGYNNNNNKPHINPSQSSSPTRQFSKIMTPSKISNVFTPKKDVLKQSIKQAYNYIIILLNSGKSILDPLTPGQKMGRISSAHYSSSSQSPTDFEPSRSKSSNMIGLKLDNICDDIILTGDSRFYDVDAPFDVSYIYNIYIFLYSEVSCELMGNNKLIYDYYNSMEDVGKNQIALNVQPPPPNQTKLSTIRSTNEDDYDGGNNEFSDSFDDDEDNDNKEHDALDEFISTSKKGVK